ncbi:hypothetical protein IT084_04460 [Desulfallas sp. Bu1-1]|uniref:hypothetical protein n=1 Tax=Desulfallas sp. Bu1-1 TaxID=2787620 RepID=UPI00189FF08F|nr:hypothetical protein [Desulfallas sp. Bu1-1]MBF7082227.1 hypothetical protein [Desulfallas sp. Bu1-1]
MNIEIKRVGNSAGMQAFLAVPYKVYGEKAVPPSAASFMTSARFSPLFNPGLEHIRFANFVAIKEGQPVGRITASIDSLNPRPEEGFFGSFECVDSPEVAGSLLDAAAGWLKKQNKTVMVGPATLNTNQQVGILIEGFDKEMQNELPYNPPYYQNLLEEAGLVKIQDLECFSWKLPETIPHAFEKKGRLENVVIRPVNPGLRDARLIQEIYNKAFSEMWGFIPMSLGDVQGLMMGAGQHIPRSLFLIIEVDRKPAAMFLSIPYKKPKKDGTGGKVRLAVAGIVPEFRKKGLHRQGLGVFYKICRRLGYTEGEASQVAESNDTVKRVIIKPIFGGDVTKIYRVYRRDLT